MTTPGRNRSTPPRTGGAGRSWAMLADLMNNHLDPGYVEAARRRQLRPPPSAAERRCLSALTALTVAAVGVILAVAYQQTATTAPEMARTRAALVDAVQQRSAQTDALQGDVDTLRATVAGEQEDALTDSEAGQTAARQLRELEAVTGLAPVRGPGVVVRLADGPPPEDPVTGDPTGEVDLGRVQDRDLQDVVNALWRAGAEAVTVDGQRLAATSTIRAAGEAVLVDFRPVDSPYVIEAVGDPDELHRRFVASAAARRVRGYVKEYEMSFAVRRADQLSLRAGSPPRLHAAQPVPSEASGAGPSAGPSGAGKSPARPGHGATRPPSNRSPGGTAPPGGDR